MTNFVRDVDLTIDKGLVWRPAKRNEPVYHLIVGYAPSGRAKCRKCSQVIQKGELRCGIPIRHSMGEHGRISAWQHLGCTRVNMEELFSSSEDKEDDESTTRKLEKIIYGLEQCSEEDKQRVLEEVISDKIPEHLMALDTNDLTKRGRMPEAEPPKHLLRMLLPYQKEGLHWMLAQERSTPYKGGILADEMGMGKTIQIIALLLAHRVPGPTLVVCPVSSMMQWKSEIEQHVVSNTLIVKVMSKTSTASVEEMESADVVLTTYPMIEHAWRNLVNELKVPCKYCGQLFLPRQIVVHNKYFCGPLAKQTAKQMKRERDRKNADRGKYNSDEAPPRSRKVQSKETIAKGLRTLHVALDDDDNEDDLVGEVKVEQGEKMDGSEEPDSLTVNAKKEEEEEEEVVAQKPKSIAGPMGMYAELMREAKRKIRSRWKKAEESESDETEDGSESRELDSDSDSDPKKRRRRYSHLNNNKKRRVESDDDDDDGEKEEEEEEEDENDLEAEAVLAERMEREAQQKQKFKQFTCDHCGFQKLRYPFCPKTGQHHVVPSEWQDVINTDTGGDDVNLQESPFHKIRWSRIVLDEAHRIKERTTSTARSAFALTAEYRWCLTGTPLQNRVGDLYSLLRFLRLKPFSHYYCGTEGCSCSSLSHPFSGTSLRECVFCGHGPIQHFAFFNKHILNPITRYGYIGDGRLGMLMLHNEVFSKVMLRRTKEERAEDLRLPSMEIKKVLIQLTDEERNFYESLYKKCTTQFDTFVAKGTVLHNYAHIFQLLSRLRQSLDHPLLVVRGMELGEVRYQEGLCGICSEGLEPENPSSFLKVDPCRHGFHKMCLSQFLESAPDKKFHCPICFVTLNVDLRQLRFTTEADVPGDGDADDDVEGLMAMTAALPPDMMEEEEEQLQADEDNLLALLPSPTTACSPNVAEEIREEKPSSASPEMPTPTAAPSSPRTTSAAKAKAGVLARIDTSKPLVGTKLMAIVRYVKDIPQEEKVIIFSQFGEMLDLTQYVMQRHGIKSVKLSGSLSLSQRQAVLLAFQTDPSVKVILISLKAGGEGLNLQNANHVVLIDPWWNPAVEMQAVQRAHRIGQTRTVHAVRFVTENSVEERMVDLQDKKMLVFEGTVDGAVNSLKKLTSEDLQFLFAR